MSTDTSAAKINMPKFQNNLFTFFATLSGVAIGVMASLAMVGPMIHSEVASATKGLSRTIDAKPASSVTSCVAPAGDSGTAHNASAAKTAVATMPSERGGGDDMTGSKPWVHNLVGGLWATTTATISDTGPGSHNSVKTVNTNTTTITNNNNVSVSNSSTQTSNSGSANTSGNTNAGSATSGESANSNESWTSLNINN